MLACDAFNALVSDRPYRSALPVGVAVAELERCAGAQFDPAVVAALLGCIRADGTVAPAENEGELADLLAPPESDGDARRLERELHSTT